MCVVGASLAPFGALIFIVSARFLIVHVSFSFSSYYLLTTRQEPSHTILCRVLNKSPVTSARFSEERGYKWGVYSRTRSARKRSGGPRRPCPSTTVSLMILFPLPNSRRATRRATNTPRANTPRANTPRRP